MPRNSAPSPLMAGQALTQLEGLASRMQRLPASTDIEHAHTSADEVLVEMLMVVGKSMPHLHQVAIGRALTAYDQIPKAYA